MNERLVELSMMYRCEYCLAAPQVWCRTRIGAKATILHSQRTDPLRLAWLGGREQAAEWREREREQAQPLRGLNR